MISHKYGCIFIHIPKCAGTSIEHVLGHFEGHTANRGGQDHRSLRMIEMPLLTVHSVSSLENIHELYRRFKHQQVRKLLNQNNKISVTSEQYKEYFKFTIVRNPWSRAYSWYRNVMHDEIHKAKLGIENDITYKAFLKKYIGKGMLRPQTYWLKNFSGSVDLDFVGRFENLHEDVKEAFKRMGLQNLDLPHKIKGDSENFQDYYDQETINIVENAYSEEINLFGYSFK